MFGATSLLWETDGVNVSEQCWILSRVNQKLKMLDILSTTHWHFLCQVWSVLQLCGKTKEAGECWLLLDWCCHLGWSEEPSIEKPVRQTRRKGYLLKKKTLKVKPTESQSEHVDNQLQSVKLNTYNIKYSSRGSRGLYHCTSDSV